MYATLDWEKAVEIIRESRARNADAGVPGDVVTPVLLGGVPTGPMDRVFVFLRDGLPANRGTFGSYDSYQFFQGLRGLRAP